MLDDDSLSSLKKTAAHVSAAVLAPNAERVDKDAEWPKDSLHAIAAAGLMGLHVPRNLGGLDEGLLSLAIVTEELGRTCSLNGDVLWDALRRHEGACGQGYGISGGTVFAADRGRTAHHDACTE